MGLEEFVRKAEKAVSDVGALDKPIQDIETPVSLALTKKADAAANLGSIGDVTLGGSLTARAAVTRRASPPLDLSAAQDEPGGDVQAWTSLVFGAQAKAGLDTEEPVSATASVTAGVTAGGSVAFAHHRLTSTDETALDALIGHLEKIKTPFVAESVGALVEGEILQLEMDGSAVLRASAGWGYGFARHLEGGPLDKLGAGSLGGFGAQVKAGLTFKASLTGQLRVLADASPRRDGWIRIRLEKRESSFVGAGLTLTAQANLTQPDLFVDSLLSRLLEVPEDAVRRARELRDRLREARSRLDQLAGSAKQKIANAAGTTAGSLKLDDVKTLCQQLATLPPSVKALVEPLCEVVSRAEALLGEAEGELQQWVDATFQRAATPLDTVSSTLEGWIAGYDALRERSLESLQSHAKEGIHAELSAAINRTRTGEALLDVDFDPSLALSECMAALRGNLSPALVKAQVGGAEGVELQGGTLKETTRRERNLALKLNLFGFKSAVDFTKWSQVTVTDDLGDGTVYVTGQAGASFAAAAERRRAQELSFVFDLASGAERRDGSLLLDATAGFHATVVRTAELQKAREINAVMPRNVEEMGRLCGLGEAQRGDLLRQLKSETGPYRYVLRLELPPSAVPRVFMLGADLRAKELDTITWRMLRRSLEALDMEIPYAGKTCLLLSNLIDDEAIRAVSFQPTIDTWRTLRRLRARSPKLDDGALKMICAYLLNLYEFVGAFRDARTDMLGSSDVATITASLSGIARKVVDTAGMFGTRPIDAKYLMFALLEGRSEAEMSFTFARGAVEVTV